LKPRPIFQVTLLAALLSPLCIASQVHAFEYRRPDLTGTYTDRRITNPLNAMTVIAGPGTSYTFGQRYDDRSYEGGVEYGRRVALTLPQPDPVQEVRSRFGVAFGLLPYLDAGALFLNFEYAPEFAFTEVLVFVTQAFNLGDWELATRLSFLTPGGPGGWEFNPGGMFAYRGGTYKLEAGTFWAIGAGSLLNDKVTDAHYLGLNVPLRAVLNITPALFAGIETGFLIPRFDEMDRSSLPLGGLLGYTILSGKRLIDFSASVKWDEFLYFSPASGINAVQSDNYRVDIGVTLHQMVVPPKR